MSSKDKAPFSLFADEEFKKTANHERLALKGCKRETDRKAELPARAWEAGDKRSVCGGQPRADARAVCVWRCLRYPAVIIAMTTPVAAPLAGIAATQHKQFTALKLKLNTLHKYFGGHSSLSALRAGWLKTPEQCILGVFVSVPAASLRSGAALVLRGRRRSTPPSRGSRSLRLHNADAVPRSS
ncbi:hypothetical protein ANANG_G00272440 [Anguilla anguilla]|uniref:Uncharacterized protein n=1 Tax=Anguilla anguilla TaxID=7936 RepID=A0A9D3RK65_ANGAN|nr:hypothetical protein ANANG_G00272440 [Anguilla anguilla]